MNSPTTVRLCLVGAGRMGRLRAPHIQADPRVTLCAVVDSWRAGGEALAAQHPGCQYHATLSDAIADADAAVAAVWISTPTDAHSAVIRTAAAAGLPVFTEKPVAEDADDIGALFAVCEAAGVPLCCGFQRRFDDSYRACADTVAAGKIGTPTMSTVFFGDHPVPPLEFLKNGGCPFMDLSPHDVDYVRWVLGQEPVEIFASGCSSTPELAAANVLDNAFMFVKFSGGTMVTLQMSRGATYGYDQRCEFFGDKGVAAVGNQFKTSDTFADASGCHAAVLKHSFPQRFAQAFAAEVAAFAEVVLDGAVWPVTCRDCVVVQSIARAAATSQKEGRVVPFVMPAQYAGVTAASATKTTTAPALVPAIRVRAIGAGSFGTYIRELVTVAGDVRWLPGPSFTRSSGLDWDADLVSADSGVDAVYVASPDALHLEHALACLKAGKHVLVEKPVVGFPALTAGLAAGRRSAPALMVGFQRRFASEFLRAKAKVATARPRRVEIESRDPVPAVADMAFVVNNSMCHDIDMLNWLLPGSAGIEWDTAERSAARSSVELRGRVVFAEGPAVDIKVSYSKEHASYVQRVVVDGQCFGYDFRPADGEMECAIYADAYRAQWKHFAACCNTATGCRVAGAGARAMAESPAQTAARLASYERTFAWLEQLQTAFAPAE